MDFGRHFLWLFTDSLWFLSPILLVLLGGISALGLWIGRIEEWSVEDSMYFAFVTATTVGYGDLHPTKRPSKFLAISISLLGILLTGLLVALALNAANFSFKITHDMEAVAERYRAKQEP